ncbi:MAG: tetratricopeptide repeat protein [Alphaproteobacteria bacterium]
MADGSNAAPGPRNGVVAALFRQAVERHARNDLKAAEQGYRAVLAQAPGHAQGWYRLGVLLGQTGRAAEGVEALRKSLSIDARHAEAHRNLGVLLHALGRYDEAAAATRRCIALKPGDAEAHANLALALRKLGRLDAALTSIRRAVELDPKSAGAAFSLGNILTDAGDGAGAEAAFRRAVELRPGHAQALNNLGNALIRRGAPAEAIPCFRQAIASKPDHAEAHMNLGYALQEVGALEKAIAAFRRATALAAASAPAHAGLGGALLGTGAYEEAARALRQALALDPGLPEAQDSLGRLALAEGRVDQALEAFNQAIDAFEAREGRPIIAGEAFRPDAPLAWRAYGEARINLSMARLLKGEYEAGFREYEWRWARSWLAPRKFDEPLFSLDAPKGSTVLVYAEQGQGDTIHFVRYVPLLTARGYRVVLEVQPSLLRLLDGIGGATVVPAGSVLPRFDHQVALLSLPRVFGTRLETIPADIPYLSAPEDSTAKWQARLGPTPGLKVGLVWRGSATYGNDKNRSLDPRLLAPLFGLSGVRLHSLQKEPRDGDMAALRGLGPFVDLADGLGDFADTAGALMALDLLVAVDTSVAHLAGALGRPAWILLPFAPDWRWMQQREDSPWYPTARLFRQPARGDWPAVINRVATALEARIAG